MSLINSISQVYKGSPEFHKAVSNTETDKERAKELEETLFSLCEHRLC
jgi:hypothetical protein